MPGGRKVKELTDEVEICLWNKIVFHAGEVFTTSGKAKLLGITFTYEVRGAELFLSTREKSITRSTLVKASHKSLELEGNVAGSETLGGYGSSYI